MKKYDNRFFILDNLNIDINYTGVLSPGKTIVNNKNVAAKIIGRIEKSKYVYDFVLQYEDGSYGMHDYRTLYTLTFQFPLSFRGSSNKENKYHTVSKRYYGMIDRCRNITSKDYNRYGARGIEMKFISIYDFYFYVCKLDNFDKLISDPLHWEFDRIDNNGNYEKGNLRIVTRKINQRNKRNNHIYVIKDEQGNILFTGIKVDSEKFIYEYLGIKIHIDAYYKNKNFIGSRQNRKLTVDRLS